MTIHELVIILRNKNIHLYDDGDTFKVQAPEGTLTSLLADAITTYRSELLYLVKMSDVRVCPVRWEHRPQWGYSRIAQSFICYACRGEPAA
jgi:hypothetical protein